MTFLSRRFADSSDIPLLVDWVRLERPPERVTDYPSVIDLPELLALSHNQETTRIWFAETGELLGFAFVDVFHTLRLEMDWQRTTPTLESAVVAWGSECLVKTVASALLYATSHEADTSRLAFLERGGFGRAADCILHLERSLATPISAPQLSAGFRLRPLEGEHEAAELAQLHRQAFGTLHMTTERRLALMRRPYYDPGLDLVVVNAEGVLTAYGMGSISPQENMLTGRNECYADLFATHPDFRGHGFARAILIRLLQLLQARGFATTKLSTSSENMSMQRVAMSEGFQIQSKTLRFARSVNSNQQAGSRAVA